MLDATFGPLLGPLPRAWGPPAYDWERNFSPDSLSRLDDQSARSLKQAMDEILAGWDVGRVLTHDILLLWLVDAAGDVWFALEELVFGSTPTGRPKHQKLPLTANLPKLGHPSLNRCAQARIAGEIYFDSGFDPPLWIINNNSGRYGRHPSRTSMHLDNVVALFDQYKISLKPDFRPA